MEHHPRLGYILLAAGASRRFGGCKQLATIDFQQSLLEHSIEIALDVSPGEVFLVLGAHRDLINETLELENRYPRVHVIVNEQWEQGVSSSIRAALDATDHEGKHDGIMLLLADQVAITPEQLKSMRSAWFLAPDKIFAAEYSNTLGAPAIFPKTLFSALRQLKGDQGAKPLLEQHHDQAVPFPLKEAKWDIDTEEQLNDFQIETL